MGEEEALIEVRFTVWIDDPEALKKWVEQRKDEDPELQECPTPIKVGEALLDFYDAKLADRGLLITEWDAETK